MEDFSKCGEVAMRGLKQSEKRQVLRGGQMVRLELEEDSSRVKEMVEA
jgi:hypothetical protein